MNHQPYLSSTAIKFIFMFRNQLPDDTLLVLLGQVSNFMKSDNYIVRSYSAATIEKLVMRKSLENQK